MESLKKLVNESKAIPLAATQLIPEERDYLEQAWKYSGEVLFMRSIRLMAWVRYLELSL